MLTPKSSDGRVAAFNYDSLPADKAKLAQTKATLIKARLNANFFGTGRDLIAVKRAIGRGAFGAWIAAEFGMTMRTAQRYMRAARVAHRCDEVSQLLPSAVYALGEVESDTVQKLIVDKLRAGEILGKADIQRIIRQSELDEDAQPPQERKGASTGGNLEPVEKSGDSIVGLTERTARTISRREPPTEGEFFWGRLHRERGRLVIDRLSATAPTSGPRRA